MSGRAAIPRDGTHIEPRNRVCYLDHDIIQSMLKGNEATEILQKLITNVHNQFELIDVGPAWHEGTDLFEFLTTQMGPIMIDTFFGPFLTRTVDPQFVRTFWEFDSWITAIAKKVPRWIYPQGFRARERLVRSLMRWRLMTRQMTHNGQETGASRRILRKMELLKADDWDVEAIAATDLGFICIVSNYASI